MQTTLTTVSALVGALLLSQPVAATEKTPLTAVGISVGSLDNPFFKALVRGAAEEVRHINPAAQINTMSSDFALDKQLGQIDQFIAAKVDMILLVAAHPQQIEGAVHKAQAAGIKVIAVDVEALGADITVQSDNRQAGKAVCDYLAEKIGGKGNLIIQNGPTVSSIRDRVEGCHNSLKRYPGIKLLEDKGDGKASSYGGMNLMQEHLQRYPKIDAVFAINDRQAIGADKAARSQGRQEMIIGSVDGSPDIEAALQQDTRVRVSAGQNPFLLGKTAAQLGNRLVNGESPPERDIRMPVPLLTRDNVREYKGWGAVH